MAQKNPQEVADRWASRLGASTDKVRSGVQAVTVSPGTLASQAAATWQARVSSQEALSKFQQNTAKLNLGDWQSSMINKGLARISSGANAAKPKFADFLSQFLPFVEGVAQRVRQMPNITLEDRINRAVAQIRGVAAFKRQ